MKKLKLLKLLPLLFFISSCAAVKYGIDAGVGKSTYVEELSAIKLEADTGKTIDIGISEETKYIITRIHYTKSNYDDFNYGSSKLGLDHSGWDVSLGVKLGWLQPRFTIGKSTFNYTIDGEQSSDDIDMSGFGVALEFQFSENGYVWFAYDKLNRWNKIETDIYSESEITFTKTSIGLRFNFASIDGENKF